MKTFRVCLLFLLAVVETTHAQIEDPNLQKTDTIQQNADTTLQNTITPDMTDSLNVDKKFLLGKTNFPTDSRFIQVDSDYTDKESYVLKEVYDAFLQMYEAALKDDIKLLIISGARNFNYQKGIWERKWDNLRHIDREERAAKILEFSAMPMSSRHHWGTDIDLNNLENEYFEEGEGLKIYTWLQENGPKFGFCQVYTDKNLNGRKGFEMEKWHWSYIPLSKGFLAQYNEEVGYEDIKGFWGSDLAPTFNIIEDYVNGIADCGKETE